MATFKNRNIKPQPLPPDFDAIPGYVKKLDQWVLWRYDWKGDEQGEWAKVPYNAWTLRYASVSDKTTWTSFDAAVAAYRRNADSFAGIGFVFTKQAGICGIDFDNCIVVGDGEHELSSIARHWIGVLDSYAELSPSGTGLHALVLAEVLAGRKDSKTEIEVYDSGRYFTFTGRSWHERPLQIAERQAEVNALWSEVFAVKEERPPTSEPARTIGNAQMLLDVAFGAANGQKIKRLFEGDISEYGDDDSAADMALCNYLAFYSGGNPSLLDEMFRASGLMRPKWDEKHYGDGRTYGEETINKALVGCTEFYNQSKKTPKPAEGIKTVFDYKDELEELYQTGYVPGADTGWKYLSRLYTVKPGHWTVVTGSPGSGKSVWLNALLVNLAMQHGWRFVICSPEFWPVSTHIAELMTLYVGEPFVPGPTMRMSQATARKAVGWVAEHFTFIDTGDHALTMDYVLEAASTVHAENPINGLVLDPWTEFEQDRLPGETETDFTKRTLTNFGRFVRFNMLHGWIVAHPKMLRRDNTGQYPVPSLYDISGSAHWFNKPYMGVSLHRPDPQSTKVQVHVQKVKFRWCGQLGYAELFYDKVTGRYNEPINTYQTVEAERW